MIRVVVDTNVYISSFVFGGIPRRALELRLGGTHTFCTSAPILAEVRRVLIERFDYAPARADQMVRSLRQQSRFVVPTESIAACSDPDDDMVLECAVAGKAKVIVTGDKALLRLDPFRGIRIVTPGQLLLDAAASYR